PLAALPGFATWARDSRGLSVIGRLASGATVEQASAEIAAIAERLRREHPETNDDVRATAAPMLQQLREGARPILMTLMGAVLFVLLIACANVANLLLARAASRSREIAIRASLGASRRRIVHQLLIESFLLAAVAGAGGLLLSLWSVRYFGIAFDAIEAAGTSTPYWVNLRMNAPVFAFLAAASIGSSLAFGLVPALHLSRVGVYDTLKDGGGAGVISARRWTQALMIGELALTVVLLTGAGLVVRSFLIIYNTNLVIDTDGIVTARLTLPMQQYATPEKRKALAARLDDRLAANPAYASAAAVSEVPLTSLGPPIRTLAIEGRPIPAGEEPPRISAVVVGRRYLETIGIRPVRGRDFIVGDGGPGREAAIVNQRFVTTYFPSTDPIGQRIRIADLQSAAGRAPRSFSIVGVIPSVPGAAIGTALRAPDPVVYLPLSAEPGAGRFLAVIGRVQGSQPAMAAAISALREDLRVLDPDVPLYAMQSLDAVVERGQFSQRFAVNLFGLLALIAVVLSAVGVFALTAQAVAQRTREIGVRMALGAQPSQVVWLFLRRTCVQLAIGLLIGLVGALWVGRLIEGFLVGTGPRDPITLAAIALFLALVSIVSSALPTRRATRIDPVEALRYE
ncbi:MAG TPA: FtsX-like permease family protein, partial [Vicinamibacterales bacterium]|nr:FtsX-like permease family protein [Vicinamibacterales bacterium]